MAQTQTQTRQNSWGETLRLVVLAGALALSVRSCLFQPFTIPSGSMVPSLWVGDYLFVNKFAYGYSRHSLPFSPNLFSGRIWATPPKRGDVVVFKLPSDNRTDFIKRVIGLPGDEIAIRGGEVYLNGTRAARHQLPNFQLGPAEGRRLSARQYQETLRDNGGASYRVLDITANSPGDEMGRVRVPAGHYFMLGDNRDNSHDSRFANGVGFVPFENLVGRASLLFFSFDSQHAFWQVWAYPRAIRWQRLLRAVE